MPSRSSASAGRRSTRLPRAEQRAAHDAKTIPIAENFAIRDYRPSETKNVVTAMARGRLLCFCCSLAALALAWTTDAAAVASADPHLTDGAFTSPTTEWLGRSTIS